MVLWEIGNYFTIDVQNRLAIIILSCLCIFCCKNPFDITPAEKSDYIKLGTEYNVNQRIIDTLSVKLKWNDITLDNFKEIKIARFNEHRDSLTYLVGAAVNGWITFATINNPFITSWVNTVKDDAVFQYCLRYYNINNDFYQSNTFITIRPTTHVFVPFEFDSVRGALESYIIDEGDTIFKCMDEFDTVSDTSFGYKVDYKKDSTKIIIIEVQCD